MTPAAPDADRPLSVALANTVVGLVTLGFLLLGVLAQVAGVPAAVGAVALLALAGTGATRAVPEPEALAGRG